MFRDVRFRPKADMRPHAREEALRGRAKPATTVLHTPLGAHLSDETGHRQHHDAEENCRGRDEPDKDPGFDNNQHTKDDQQNSGKHEKPAGGLFLHHPRAHFPHRAHRHGAF